MFDLGTLKLSVKADTSEANSNLGKLKNNAQGLSSDSQQSLNKAKENVKKLSLAGIAAIGTLTTIGVKYNSEMENYRTNFGTMLGSEEKAVQKVNELKKMAEATPFGMADLADATQTLLSFQVPAEKTNSTLKMLGDISMGNKDKLKGLSLVFGQVSSAGKLQGQDLLQMINQGFNPLNYISKRTGESMEQLRDRMSKGAISANEVSQAFEDATNKGGQFYNGMERGSKTTSGMVSTLKDNLTSKVGELTQKISEKLKDLLPKVIDFISKIDTDKVIKGIEKTIDVVTWLAPPILAVIAVMKTWKAVMVTMEVINVVVNSLKALKAGTTASTVAQNGLNMAMLANPVFLIIAAIAALVAIFAVLWVKCEGFRNFWKGFAKGIKDTFLKVVDWLKETFTKTIPNAFKSLTSWIGNIFNTDWSKKIGFLGEPLNAFFKNLKNIFGGIKEIFSGIIGFVKNVFTGNWKGAWESIKKIFKGIWDTFSGIVKAPLNAIIGLVNGLIGGINFIIKGINKIKFDVPDWVPAIGGKKLGFNLKEINKIKYFADGGIMTQPTVFGYGNGVNVGGEAGAEAVIPLSKLPELMKKMGYIKPSAIHTSINIDGREFAVATSPYIGEELAFG